MTLRGLIFTTAISCASRALMARDRILGRLGDARLAETRCQIASGRNTLDAVLSGPAASAACVLICHGIGETVEYWSGVQALLADCKVTSLVFDYSGYGRSTGWIDAAQMERDALSAYGFLARMRPGEEIAILGFSLGSAIATAIVTNLGAKRLVLCAAFPSLREAARRAGARSVLARMLPDIWNTEEVLRSWPESTRVVVLIMHGEQDMLFPVSMARTLAAARLGGELLIVPGLTHNAPIYAPFQEPQRGYWLRVVEFLTR